MSDDLTERLQQLVLSPGAAQLGPGRRPGVLAAAALEAELDTIFRAARVPEPTQELARALLLLWHDHLDASHTISQRIENRDGSLVHAIMHRREPDYWNSKYWWRRVGYHACFPELAGRVAGLLRPRGETELAARLLPGSRWDASAFVDECAAVASSPNDQRESLLQAIQQIETQVALRQFLGSGVLLEFA